jgi:hypothetical protein
MPTSFVVAWQARQTAKAQRADRIEATMRRYEMPCTVDLAKRLDSAQQLSRLLDI